MLIYDHHSFYGAIAVAGITYQLAFTGYRLASARGRTASRGYLLCSAIMMILWTGYAICWGLAEGGNAIGPAEEGIFYGLLDLLATPVFGALTALTASRLHTEGN